MGVAGSGLDFVVHEQVSDRRQPFADQQSFAGIAMPQIPCSELAAIRNGETPELLECGPIVVLNQLESSYNRFIFNHIG